jgi:hypothetical protein
MNQYSNILYTNPNEPIEIEDEVIDAIPVYEPVTEQQQPYTTHHSRFVPVDKYCTHCKTNNIKCRLFGARALGCFECIKSKLICDIITTHPLKNAKRQETNKEYYRRKRVCLPSVSQLLEEAAPPNETSPPSPNPGNTPSTPQPNISMGDAILTQLVIQTRLLEAQAKYGTQTEWFIRCVIPTIGQVLEEIDKSRVMLPSSQKLVDIWNRGMNYDPARARPTQSPIVTTSSSTVREKTTTTQTTTSIAPLYLQPPMTSEQMAVAMGIREQSNTQQDVPPTQNVSTAESIPQQTAKISNSVPTTWIVQPPHYTPPSCVYPKCKGSRIDGKAICVNHEITIKQKLGRIKREP